MDKLGKGLSPLLLDVDAVEFFDTFGDFFGGSSSGGGVALFVARENPASIQAFVVACFIFLACCWSILAIGFAGW